jgi:hypothetical protein
LAYDDAVRRLKPAKAHAYVNFKAQGPTITNVIRCSSPKPQGRETTPLQAKSQPAVPALLQQAACEGRPIGTKLEYRLTGSRPQQADVPMCQSAEGQPPLWKAVEATPSSHSAMSTWPQQVAALRSQLPMRDAFQIQGHQFNSQLPSAPACMPSSVYGRAVHG